MSDSMSLSALVDLARYPLRDDAAFAPIAERCRAQLAESSFASLPGFVRPDVAAVTTDPTRAGTAELAVDVRGNAEPATLVELPFYRRRS